MADPLKSPLHNFVFDERNHMIVSMFMQSVTQTVEGATYFREMCKKYDVTLGELDSFMQEWSDAEHAMGWCKDPNCKVPNGPQV